MKSPNTWIVLVKVSGHSFTVINVTGYSPGPGKGYTNEDARVSSNCPVPRSITQRPALLPGVVFVNATPRPSHCSTALNAAGVWATAATSTCITVSQSPLIGVTVTV